MMRAVFTGLAILALASPAAAAPKAKKKVPGAIEVSNKRAITLSSFELAGADGKPVAKLAKPLAAGKKTSLRLVRAKGCDYVARWQFEDAGDQAQVDLCNDPKIILTD